MNLRSHKDSFSTLMYVLMHFTYFNYVKFYPYVYVDSIPPPPVGLEELLKQEREQTQWLEKQLSLADPQVDISPYSTESGCLDSGNYSSSKLQLDFLTCQLVSFTVLISKVIYIKKYTSYVEEM